jgi:NADPH:quinone reductase-like Zn-dependent oxidoreductase
MKREIPEAPMNEARALWYTARGQAAIRPVILSKPARDQALVRTLWSGLSRGTERLVFEGRISSAESERMRAPLQEGDFPHPVKYGYCAVGMVETGPDAFRGRTVFVLHPHQDRFLAPLALLNLVPASVPPRRAILAANMETALNGLWDSGAGPGDRILVVGAGLVGCLVAFLAAQLPGAEVTLVDIDPTRRSLAERLGAAFELPPAAPDGMDVVFHCSATAPGLSCALAAAGMEAPVVEMSWYGDEMVPAPLGRDFHARRLRLVSSQVGQVAPLRRSRWTHGRRMAKALDLLADERLDGLISEEVAFAELPVRLPGLLAPRAPGLATAIRYD